MGTSIGQISASSIAARRIASDTPPAERPAFTFSQPGAASASVDGGGDRIETPAAGFGPGTLSGPGAALITLGRGVQAAREAIPTLDEIRARFQSDRTARAEQEGVRNEERLAGFAGRPGETHSGVPAADPLALNRFNQALEFSEPSAPESAAFASARPPEAPEFVTAGQADERRPAAAAPRTEGAAQDFVQRQRLDVSA